MNSGENLQQNYGMRTVNGTVVEGCKPEVRSTMRALTERPVALFLNTSALQIARERSQKSWEVYRIGFPIWLVTGRSHCLLISFEIKFVAFSLNWKVRKMYFCNIYAHNNKKKLKHQQSIVRAPTDAQ